MLLEKLKIKQKEEKDRIPRSVQQAIPIKKIYEDGTFQVGWNKYSKTYKFTDINYMVAGKEEQERMFLGYGSILNLLDYACFPKITIINRKLNKIDFENKVKIPIGNDKLTKYRKEINNMLLHNSTEAKTDYFKMGNRYGRVLFIKEFANFIRDDIISELTELNKNMMLSIDMKPVPMEEAIKMAENKRMGVETNIARWQKSQNENNNFSAEIPYELQKQREESKEFLDDLITRDQKMFLATITIVHTADTKEELDNDTETLKSIAGKHLCQLGELKYQQLDGLKTVMPYGVKKIETIKE